MTETESYVHLGVPCSTWHVVPFIIHSEMFIEHLLWARPWNTVLSTTVVGTPGASPRSGGSLFVLDARKCGDRLLFILRHHWILDFPGTIREVPSIDSMEVTPFPTVNLEPGSPRRDPWNIVSLSKRGQ